MRYAAGALSPPQFVRNLLVVLLCSSVELTECVDNNSESLQPTLHLN